MPYEQWKHRCGSSDNRIIWVGSPICPSCGEKGEYDGLGLSGIEAQGNFMKLTGLPSIGPHMPNLPKFYELCPTCNGRSVVEPHRDGLWISCRSCEGTGGIITVSEKRFVKVQKEAWALFDNWRLEKANEIQRKAIEYQSSHRIYKSIFKRDHYRPRPCKRIRRYRARYEKLMPLTVNPEGCVPELLGEWENLKPPKSNVDFTRGRNS